MVDGCNIVINYGFWVNVGYGFIYENVYLVVCLKGMEEFNIGYIIVFKVVFVGMEWVVCEMKFVINGKF